MHGGTLLPQRWVGYDLRPGIVAKLKVASDAMTSRKLGATPPRPGSYADVCVWHALKTLQELATIAGYDSDSTPPRLYLHDI